MAVAFPGESAEYRAARNRLVDQEIELRRAMEAVAEARRRLPPGGVAPGQEPRHVGTIEPLWNLFDLTPEGRPATWHEQFSYGPPREQGRGSPV
jgi:predicted dithiol-disulfide oxidoreductase (DUF899 family)